MFVRHTASCIPTGSCGSCEPTGHLGTDEAALRARVTAFGFDVAAVETRGQFTFVRADRGDRAPTANPEARIKANVAELRSAGHAVRPDVQETTLAAQSAIVEKLLAAQAKTTAGGAGR